MSKNVQHENNARLSFNMYIFISEELKCWKFLEVGLKNKNIMDIYVVNQENFKHISKNKSKEIIEKMAKNILNKLFVVQEVIFEGVTELLAYETYLGQ